MPAENERRPLLVSLPFRNSPRDPDGQRSYAELEFERPKLRGARVSMWITADQAAALLRMSDNGGGDDEQMIVERMQEMLTPERIRAFVALSGTPTAEEVEHFLEGGKAATVGVLTYAKRVGVDPSSARARIKAAAEGHWNVSATCEVSGEPDPR